MAALLELDSNLRIAHPYYSAGSGWMIRQDKFKRPGDSIGGLNLKTSAGF
jgi:hypothetical protein